MVLRVPGKKKVHKLRLSVEDLMMGGDGRGGRKAAPPKRKRSPSPGRGSVDSLKASATPAGTPTTGGAAGANKRKSMRPTLGKKFK